MGAIVLWIPLVWPFVVNANLATESTVDQTGLPPDLAEAFRRAANLNEPPETLEEGFSAVGNRLTEAGITVTLEDMYQSAPTRHAVHVGDVVEHVPCVMDALIAAVLLDESEVEIHSESPVGDEPIRFDVSEGEVTVTPASAVVSFGLGFEDSTDPCLDSLRDTLNDPDSLIPKTCSVINAFPDSDAYEQWAAEVTDAAVMELSINTMFSLSQQAVQSHVTE